MLKQIAEKNNKLRNFYILIKMLAWLARYDNVNLEFKAMQECLNNKSHFDSGMAGTVYIIHDCSVV